MNSLPNKIVDTLLEAEDVDVSKFVGGHFRSQSQALTRLFKVKKTAYWGASSYLPHVVSLGQGYQLVLDRVSGSHSSTVDINAYFGLEHQKSDSRTFVGCLTVEKKDQAGLIMAGEDFNAFVQEAKRIAQEGESSSLVFIAIRRALAKVFDTAFSRRSAFLRSTQESAADDYGVDPADIVGPVLAATEPGAYMQRSLGEHEFRWSRAVIIANRPGAKLHLIVTAENEGYIRCLISYPFPQYAGDHRTTLICFERELPPTEDDPQETAHYKFYRSVFERILALSSRRWPGLHDLKMAARAALTDAMVACGKGV